MAIFSQPRDTNTKISAATEQESLIEKVVLDWEMCTCFRPGDSFCTLSNTKVNFHKCCQEWKSKCIIGHFIFIFLPTWEKTSNIHKGKNFSADEESWNGKNGRRVREWLIMSANSAFFHFLIARLLCNIEKIEWMESLEIEQSIQIFLNLHSYTFISCHNQAFLFALPMLFNASKSFTKAPKEIIFRRRV